MKIAVIGTGSVADVFIVVLILVLVLIRKILANKKNHRTFLNETAQTDIGSVTYSGMETSITSIESSSVGGVNPLPAIIEMEEEIDHPIAHRLRSSCHL